MERRHQVFVSSTYTDLVEERRELIQALLEMECLPAGMELFPAADESQWELIKRAIDDSDYYIVVVGGRYGSMGPAGVSYTEQEYDYAVSTGMPVLGFVHEHPDDLPRSKTEVDPDGYAMLKEFRSKVMRKPVRFYTSADDLGGKVSRSLSIARRRNPREGWVRGRHAMTEEREAQLAGMSRRIAEQAAELDAFRNGRRSAAQMAPDLSDHLIIVRAADALRAELDQDFVIGADDDGDFTVSKLGADASVQIDVIGYQGDIPWPSPENLKGESRPRLLLVVFAGKAPDSAHYSIAAWNAKDYNRISPVFPWRDVDVELAEENSSSSQIRHAIDWLLKCAAGGSSPG